MIRHASAGTARTRTPGSLVLAFVMLVFTTACGGRDEGPRGIGPLSEVVFTGAEDGWSGSMESGVYWLENTAGAADDIRYFYTAPVAGATGERSAGVDVLTAQMTAEGMAGLLYGYQDSPRSYYLIMISGSGEVAVFRRDEDGLNRIMSSASDATKTESVRLEVREKGNELTVLANGKSVGSLQNDSIGTGLVGIAAAGTGRFGFTNYEQSPSPPTPEAALNVPGETSASLVKQAKSGDRVTYLEFMDPQLRIAQHRSPFPSGWRYDTNPNDKLLLTGPGGTEVYETDSGLFFYSDDPSARQAAQMAGRQIAPVIPLNRFLEQQFSPYMAQRGYRLVDRFPLPKIVALQELQAAAMPQGLSKRNFEALGVEWEGQDGSRAYTQLVLMLSSRPQPQGPPFIAWSVSALELYAGQAQYESARDALMYASENTEPNPRWQIAKNEELLRNIRANQQYADARTRESHIQHVGRMNAILARGEASANVAKINSDILDINHAGYLTRSNMVSAGHARTVDTIAGQSVIANPNTGEHYKVEAGSKNYWVNAEGQYFRTDNSLYDPRTDRSISNQQWQPFEVIR